jgi:FkbM family methyltransferase
MKAFLRNRFPGPWRKTRGCWHAIGCLSRGNVHYAGEHLANGFGQHPILTPVERAYFENVATAARQVPGTLSVIDVGASDGFFITSLARFYPPKRAICYEPLPESWSPPVTCHLPFPVEFRRAAVGAGTGTVELRRYTCSGLSSTLAIADDYRYLFDSALQEVVTRELLNLGQDLGPRVAELKPMLLKIDTQGNELGVLTGAGGLLDPEIIPVITLEAMVRTKYVGQAGLVDLVRFLNDRGYHVYDISRGYREPATGQHSEYDLTFCHEKYLS